MTDDSFWQGHPMERMTKVPHAMALGLEFVSADGGLGIMRVPWREDLVGDPETEVIAGGVVTALIDHACGLAVQIGRAGGQASPTPTATLDLRIDYLRPAKPRHGVTAQAQVYRYTKSIAFVRASAHDGDPDDPIAAVQAAFALTGAPITPPPQTAPGQTSLGENAS
jgi:uncharacterized protein (TIGR00369 family)